MRWPARLRIDAWMGGVGAVGGLGDDARRWAVRKDKGVRAIGRHLAPEEISDADWRHPKVGWGLILPDDDTLPASERATADDAPESIRVLMDSRRGSPVLRYRRDLGNGYLRRYRPEGGFDDVSIAGGKRGVGRACLPGYLLIFAPPEAIPWSLQYLLNTSTTAVGRLPLTGDALERYVDALINGWAESPVRRNRPVVWAVDYGPDDISSLLKEAIAQPLARELHDDPDIGDEAVCLWGEQGPATAEQLIDVLVDRRPDLVVTTSHGVTWPLDAPQELKKCLGLPVGQDTVPLDPSQLLSAWQPNGAVWYAHACCSAGADDRSRFTGVPEAEDDVDQVLRGVAAVGPRVAPLAEELLGAEQPLRAFIGHVEPTFDWTLQDPRTNAFLTASTQEAIYRGLYLGMPIGLAVKKIHDPVRTLLSLLDEAIDDLDDVNDTRDAAFAYQLAARDRQSMVLLGDPTVTLAPVA
jgi:hypothetical protein